VSSVAAARPGLDEALKYLRRDDTLVSWRLDRLQFKKYYILRWPKAKAMQAIREKVRTILRVYRKKDLRCIREVV